MAAILKSKMGAIMNVENQSTSLIGPLNRGIATDMKSFSFRDIEENIFLLVAILKSKMAAISAFET